MRRVSSWHQQLYLVEFTWANFITMPTMEMPLLVLCFSASQLNAYSAESITSKIAAESKEASVAALFRASSVFARSKAIFHVMWSRFLSNPFRVHYGNSINRLLEWKASAKKMILKCPSIHFPLLDLRRWWWWWRWAHLNIINWMKALSLKLSSYSWVHLARRSNFILHLLKLYSTYLHYGQMMAVHFSSAHYRSRSCFERTRIKIHNIFGLNMTSRNELRPVWDGDRALPTAWLCVDSVFMDPINETTGLFVNFVLTILGENLNLRYLKF